MGTRRLRILAIALAFALLASCSPTAPVRDSPATSPSSPAPSVAAPVPAELAPVMAAAAITEAGLARRLSELEAITREADGYRSLGSTGYDGAVAYVKRELEAAGWAVSADAFDADVFAPGTGGSLVVGQSTFDGETIMPLRFAPAGEANGPLAAVGWSPGPASAGCAAKDYAALPAGAVVVVRSHWVCTVRDEVVAAQEAGVSAFIAADPGPQSDVVPMIDLKTPAGLRIPAVAVSWNTALVLVAQAGQRVNARLETRAVTRTVPTESVIADLPGADASRVLIVGAHLDSVPFSPGLNDNGSGVAAILELARALAGTHPRVGIRLALWAAEENGMSGSRHYLGTLGEGARRSIVAYLNVDMIGSGNGYVGVYDEPSAAPGSSPIGNLLAAAITRYGGTSVGTDLTGRSDHSTFTEAGIPTGGVWAGAEGLVTLAQAATRGGIARRPADPCYHMVCDTSANMRLPLARLMAAALADVTVRLAEDPSLVRP